MNSVRLLKNAKIISRIFYPRNYASFSNIKQNFQCSSRTLNKSSNLKTSMDSVKCFSNHSSMQTKDSDSSNETSDDEKMRKILDDEDFKNILQDFANDFGVDNETNEILDDIRKNIDEEYEKENSTQGQHSKNEVNVVSPILGGGLDHRYKEFSDVDAKVIRSYEEVEDSSEFEDETFYHIDQELKPKLPYTNLKRGVTGVFDIHEIIEVVRNESLLDITAISIPKELHYADFLVLVTARSKRHSDAVTESIKKIYKKKKSEKDPFVIVEGVDVAEWKVMDMGNIVLHIFLEETRDLYDLETLWLFDSKYDSGGNLQRDPMLDIMEEQMEFFNSLQNSNSSEVPKDSS